MTDVMEGSRRPTERLDRTRWRDRRALSWAIRAVIVVAPIAVGLAATAVYLTLLGRPDVSIANLPVWAGAIVVSSATALLTHQQSRRLESLAVLLRLPLVFPDSAPNRLRIAFRQGSRRWLQAQLRATEFDDNAPVDGDQLLLLLTLLEQHDPVLRSHSERVHAYATLIAEAMLLPRRDVDKLRWSALTHDIGKLSVPADILRAATTTDDEQALLRDHPKAAVPYVSGLIDWIGAWGAAAVDHQEHFDGNGYPAGLSGEHISLAGRIVALADTYDTLTSPRRNQAPVSPSAAREEIARLAGTRFDPTVVRAFVSVPMTQLRLVVGPVAWLREWTWTSSLRPGSISTAVSVTAAVALAVAVSGTTSLAPGAVNSS
ncbi:MAG: HD domain-containing phosphohydrolase, partial [Actinomycetota bacterium]